MRVSTRSASAGLENVERLTVGRASAFRGRERERAELDELLDRVRGGESAALVVRGEAGIGKTALLQYCARGAADCRVAQIAGVESELELPFAAIHQLCEPLFGGIGELPEPQQQALRVAFGLAEGSVPDRFLVGLAVLGLVAGAALDRPFVCLVDDAQWLDEPSRQVLGFVGRRLQAEAVLLIVAVRETSDHQLFPSLRTMTLEGLAVEHARALVMAAVPGHLDEQIRDRIVAETGGNPLRLLEVSRSMSSGELAGGFGLPQLGTSSAHLESLYACRIRALENPTRQLLLLAAADPTGDATLLWRAAHILGIPRDAADAAASEQLLEVGFNVRFRHPLVRSAAYAAGTPGDRRAAHAALALATDAEADPERHVWHLAAAATEPDEAVALRLQQSATAAQARAGSAAAAAFLERSLELTAAPEMRADRALRAAEAHIHAGAFDAAHALLAEADAVATGEMHRARIERLKGQLQFAASPGSEAPRLLLHAAQKLEQLDAQLARETYLDAWIAALVAGPRAKAGGSLEEVSRAAKTISLPPRSSAWDYCLNGLATVITDGRVAAADSLRRAVDAFVCVGESNGEFVQWGHIATAAAITLWDWDCWDVLLAKHIKLARACGAMTSLSSALSGRGMHAVWSGDFDAAVALNAEFNALKEAVGSEWYSAGGLLHAAYQGRRDAFELVAAQDEASIERGAWLGEQIASWARAILFNALGLYADAMAYAELAAYETETIITGFALFELIEAGVRNRKQDVVLKAIKRLSNHVLDSSDWASGLEARCRGLASEGETAERWYAEAVERLSRTPILAELARAHLLYGEWLRRAGRRVDARTQLASAYGMFVEMGAEAFAERTRRELAATGEKVRKRDIATRNELTPQEEHIARLARDGHSNAEIGAELFLSVRTVEWHLRKVFQKLGLASRRELKDALPLRSRAPVQRHGLDSASTRRDTSSLAR